MLNKILIGITIIEVIVLITAIIYYRGYLKMGIMKRIKQKLPTPPPVDETEQPEITPRISTNTAHQNEPQQTQEDIFTQQKAADQEYYTRMYGDTFEAKDMKKEELTKAENLNIAFGILTELKNLNMQLAQLQELFRK